MFSFSHNVFQKASYTGLLEVGIVWPRVKPLPRWQDFRIFQIESISWWRLIIKSTEMIGIFLRNIRKCCRKRWNADFSFSYIVSERFLLLDLIKCLGIMFWTRLTLYYTVTAFNNPEKESLRKHCGKRRKCWWPAFSPFSTMFSTHPLTNLACLVTFILSSANAFNLE